MVEPKLQGRNKTERLPCRGLIQIRFQTLNNYAILTSNSGVFPLGYILVLDGELV